jgi:hypothetical protein
LLSSACWCNSFSDATLSPVDVQLPYSLIQNWSCLPGRGFIVPLDRLEQFYTRTYLSRGAIIAHTLMTGASYVEQLLSALLYSHHHIWATVLTPQAITRETITEDILIASMSSVPLFEAVRYDHQLSARCMENRMSSRPHVLSSNLSAVM